MEAYLMGVATGGAFTAWVMTLTQLLRVTRREPES